MEITKDGYGSYKISIGTGRPAKARNLEEVVYGLQHYFRESLPDSPYDFEKHNQLTEVSDCCPFCRLERR